MLYLVLFSEYSSFTGSGCLHPMRVQERIDIHSTVPHQQSDLAVGGTLAE
jgi:hypothetical protein